MRQGNRGSALISSLLSTGRESGGAFRHPHPRVLQHHQEAMTSSIAPGACPLAFLLQKPALCRSRQGRYWGRSSWLLEREIPPSLSQARGHRHSTFPCFHPGSHHRLIRVCLLILCLPSLEHKLCEGTALLVRPTVVTSGA